MRRVRDFHASHGRVQIVEIADGACHVGYLPRGGKWIHWGMGEGGFDATVGRFASCPTFNPPIREEDFEIRCDACGILQCAACATEEG